jgi:serine protease Do
MDDLSFTNIAGKTLMISIMDVKGVIEKYKKAVVQLATPFTTGTGFYLEDYKLIVTNEHVVHDNRYVIVKSNYFKKQLVRVAFTDQKYDLAFLQPPDEHEMLNVSLAVNENYTQGEQIIAVGHPFGLKYTATQGIISNTLHEAKGINYLQHDAALNPGNSGGPLVNLHGRILGINTFIIRDGNNIGFSLPSKYLRKTLDEFTLAESNSGTRCQSCGNLVFNKLIEEKYCPFCGTSLVLPSQIEAYEPIGINRTIEMMLSELGYDVRLARIGMQNWELERGSAKIRISYHNKTGLISGDVYLCSLPKDNIKPLYTYLLRENYDLKDLSLSIVGQDVLLSLLIFDRYFNVETGQEMFRRLVEKADYYDNILIEEYGARWIKGV